MQLVDQIREKLQKDSVSVLKMSNETGISAYKIYKWLDGKGNPKAEDAAIIKKWVSGNLEKVPNYNNGNEQAESLPGSITLQDFVQEKEKRIQEADARRQEIMEALRRAEQEKDRLFRLLENNLTALVEAIGMGRKEIADIGFNLAQQVKDNTDLLRITTAQLEDQRVMLSKDPKEQPQQVPVPVKKGKGASGRKLGDGKMDKDS